MHLHRMFTHKFTKEAHVCQYEQFLQGRVESRLCFVKNNKQKAIVSLPFFQLIIEPSK